MPASDAAPPLDPQDRAPGQAPGPQRPLGSDQDPGRKQARERQRARARTLRQGAVLLLLLGVAAAAVAALRPQPVPVDAARAARGPLAVAIEETGVTRVKDRYVVSAPVAGAVSRLPLEPGDEVRERDKLAEIAPALSPLLDQRTRVSAQGRLSAALSAQGQARAQEARAQAARDQAARELSRLQQLLAAGSATRQALDQAEFEARMRDEELSSAVFGSKVAAEEVRIAEAALGRDGRSGGDHHVDVLAPASGRVLRVQQKSAAVVQAGTPLLEVGDPAALEIVVDLLTTDAVHVRPGTSVAILGWGGEARLAGRVRRIEPSAFTRPSALGVDEQRVNVVVALTEPRERWAALGDGYRVEARLVLWEAADVLRVPLGAVFRSGQGWAAYRLDGEVARLVPVEIGHRGEAEVEVTRGLSAGDEVAVHPGDRVKDGARVQRR